MTLSYPNASQNVEGENMEGCCDGAEANVQGSNEGGNLENDDWWGYCETELEEFMSQAQNKKKNINVHEGNANLDNVGNEYDGDEESGGNDSLDNIEILTDDEEYVAHLSCAKETKIKVAELQEEDLNEIGGDEEECGGLGSDNINIETGVVNVQGLGPGSKANCNVPTYFDFDVGSDFKKWVSDDGNSDNDVNPVDTSDEEYL